MFVLLFNLTVRPPVPFEPPVPANPATSSGLVFGTVTAWGITGVRGPGRAPGKRNKFFPEKMALGSTWGNKRDARADAA